jgi:hypothetical protein
LLLDSILQHGAKFWSYIIEFLVKSGKHGTRNPEFGPKPGEIQKKNL